jgi:hypothetical protein
MKKTKEAKKREALVRQKHSDDSQSLSLGKPCKDCRFYSKTWCRRHEIHVPRKSHCENWVRR